VIDGAKKWIGNGTLADVIVVWARDTADRQVKGFLVEKGTPGYDAKRIDGKGSLRSVWQAEITLSGVRVPEENRLPGRSPGPTRCCGPLVLSSHGDRRQITAVRKAVRRQAITTGAAPRTPEQCTAIRLIHAHCRRATARLARPVHRAGHPFLLERPAEAAGLAAAFLTEGRRPPGSPPGQAWSASQAGTVPAGAPSRGWVAREAQAR
jgi:acyl-CoA dehydrogenase-like protein